MAIDHAEIIEFLRDELQELSLITAARPKRCKHLDESDDDYRFVEDSLDRWGDRRMPKDKSISIHARLEAEADKILETA